MHQHHREKYIVDILQGLRSFKDKIEITIRNKPNEVDEYYSYLIRHYSSIPHEQINVSSEGDFSEIINDYDIFISTYSTAVFEAAMSGKYCIFYQATGMKIQPPFDGKSEILYADTPQRLEECINDIVNDRDNAKQFNQKDVLEYYVGSLEKEKVYSAIEASLKNILLEKMNSQLNERVSR